MASWRDRLTAAEITAPRHGAEEVQRVNQLIESRLEGNGKLAVAYPYPAAAYLFVLYREIFGLTSGEGPQPLSAEESAIPIKLGNFLTDRGTARRASLEVLTLLALSMTQFPDENGEVDQTATEQRLMGWLRDTTPAIDPPFTPTDLSPGISSPQHNSLSIQPTDPAFLSIHSTQPASLSVHTSQPAMDTSSEAGGVSLGQHSPTPYHQQREVSVDTNTSGQAQHETARPAGQGIDLEEPQDSQPAAYFPMPTTRQVNSNDAASHGPQSHVFPTPQAAAPAYPPLHYGPIAGYHQAAGYSQGPPPLYPQFPPPHQYLGYGPATPSFYPHGQAAFPVHPHHGPWLYPVNPALPPAYGSMLPIPPPQHLGFQQTFPLAGHQPLYVPNSMSRKPEMALPPQQTTPIQSRLTLPPADRQAPSSAWAVPKGFNIAEWAQENRPATPPPTSGSRPAIQPSNTTANPPSQTSTLKFRFGTARMYPVSTKGAVSKPLKTLTSKGTPTFPEASKPNVFPFVDTSSYGTAPQWGVVQVGNIPYSVQRMEMYEFIGANAGILDNSMGWPVHIILDRLTGKTMDCFVEFVSIQHAQNFVEARNRPGYLNKLGDRIATVSMSTQDVLLEQTFARARNVEWRSGIPFITESSDPYNSGFKGFLSSEELVRLIQHAESPHRSGYTSKNLQRPYECMISILYKFPWHAADTYTIGQRNQIFAAANDLIRILLTHIQRKTHPYLHQTILEELLYAGLNAAGFSENQRWQLCKTAEQIGRAIRISPLAKDWPFEILSRKLDVPEDLMEYYVDRLTKHLDRRGVRPTLNPFRTFLLPPTKGDRFEVTAKAQGELEMNCVLDIYRMTLTKEGEEEEAAGPSGVEGK